jgi:HAD superfamily hydrolase (TIGR01509 family)
VTTAIPDISSLKAVVFDKDGVLADSEAINLRSAFEVFRTHGYDLGPDDEPAIVGKHPVDYVPVLARRFDIGGTEQRRMIDEQDSIYSRIWREQGRLFDGAREALDAVRRTGLGVGLATSSSRREVEEFMDRFELRRSFDITLSLDDVIHAKPAPEVYLSAARLLDIPAARMLVVEDSEHGVRAAKDAGAICVAVRSRYVPPERVGMADALIESVGELAGILEDWRSSNEGHDSA